MFLFFKKFLILSCAAAPVAAGAVYYQQEDSTFYLKKAKSKLYALKEDINLMLQLKNNETQNHYKFSQTLIKNEKNIPKLKEAIKNKKLEIIAKKSLLPNYELKIIPLQQELSQLIPLLDHGNELMIQKRQFDSQIRRAKADKQNEALSSMRKLMEEINSMTNLCSLEQEKLDMLTEYIHKNFGKKITNSNSLANSFAPRLFSKAKIVATNFNLNSMPKDEQSQLVLLMNIKNNITIYKNQINKNQSEHDFLTRVFENPSVDAPEGYNEFLIKFNEASNKIQKSKDKIHENNTNILNLKKFINSLNIEIQNHESEIVKLTESIPNIKTQINNAKIKINNYENKIINLKIEIKAQEVEIYKLQNK